MFQKGLFLVLLAVFGVAAQAVTVGETTCAANGCLRGGWDSRDYRTGHVAYVTCYDGNCEYLGWREYFTVNGREYEAICEREGCFNRGWTTYDIYTRQQVANTQCMLGADRTPSCMTGGFVSREFAYGRQMMSYCVDYDCARNGWFVYLPNGGYQRAFCKRGACFDYGWIVDQR